MDQKLRIRLDMKLSCPNTSSFIENYNHQAINQLIKSANPYAADVVPCRACIKEFSAAEIDIINHYQSDIRKICSQYSNIFVLDIEIHTDYENKDEVMDPALALPKHKTILKILKTILDKHNPEIIFVKIKDYRTGKTEYSLIPNYVPLLDDKDSGSKYRLVINDTLFTERLYPYDVYDNHQQLEENVYCSISSGKYTVQVETLGTDTIIITSIVLENDVIDTSINHTSYSFETQ
jgi:hypothetical protein